MTDKPPTSEATFTESLNYKVSRDMKARLIKQGGRLEQSQASICRLAMALGLEAIENTRAKTPGI